VNNSFIVDPVFQQYSLRVQHLLEHHNSGGLTREELGRLLEGPPPADPQLRALYDQRVERNANEQFDKVKKVCRVMFEAGIDGWGFIWGGGGGGVRYHVMAKVVNGIRTPILSYYPAGQIAQTQGKEYGTRTRSAARIAVTHVKALENHAYSMPRGPDRSALLREVE
jgi:hypothetical protein